MTTDDIFKLIAEGKAPFNDERGQKVVGLLLQAIGIFLSEQETRRYDIFNGSLGETQAKLIRQSAAMAGVMLHDTLVAIVHAQAEKPAELWVERCHKLTAVAYCQAKVHLFALVALQPTLADASKIHEVFAPFHKIVNLLKDEIYGPSEN